jgi:putative hemolysin
LEISYSEYWAFNTIAVLYNVSLTIKHFLFIFTSLFILYSILKIGQKILLNIAYYDDNDFEKPKLSIFKETTSRFNLIIHVADIFISLTFVGAVTSFIIFKFFEYNLHLPTLLFFVIAITISLSVFYMFDYSASVLSSYIVKQSKKPQIFIFPYLFLIAISFPFRKLFERGLHLERIIKRNSMTFSELTDRIERSETKPEEEQEKELIKGIFNFSDLEVSEIMKSRVDVVAFDSLTPFSDILNIIIETGYSRFPVYNENLDNIIGILHVKDVLPHIKEHEDFLWNTLIRTAFFVPENLMINELLKEFQKNKNHIAVVVDEYGGTSGIVTMEDILEEIVGEIDDEFDNESDGLKYEQLSENTYLFDGKMTLNDFCKITKIPFDTFDELKSDAETLAGIILAIEGKFPDQNQIIFFNNIQFTIVAKDNRRIKQVKVVINEETEN